MKRPEYVSVAVRACKEQRDLGFVSEETDRLLKSVFSRTGFTDGYYTGKLGKNMFGTRTKDDVVSADEKLFSTIRQSYKDELQNVAISGKFTAKIGENPVLEITDGENRVVKTLDILCEKALKMELGSEKCKNQLSKTGGTAYFFESLETDIEKGLSLPLSSLNALRREAIAELDSMRAKINNYTINDVDIDFKSRYNNRNIECRARVTGTKIGTAFKEYDLVFVPLFSDINEIKRLISQGYKIGVEVPRGMFGRDEQIEKKLYEVKEAGINNVLCHNIGAVHLAKKTGFTIHGGFGLNLVNTYDLLWAQEYGIKDVELSFELTFERINRLGGGIPRGIISYGYLPLMLCRNCPAKSEGIDCKSCKNRSKMTDRKGMNFLLKCDGNCTEVLNSIPLYIADEEIKKLSTSFHIYRFSVENYVETVENIKEINANLMLKDRFTRGLYKRGVE